MGNPDVYPPGTYTIWAESNVNQMNDNYDVTRENDKQKNHAAQPGSEPADYESNDSANADHKDSDPGDPSGNNANRCKHHGANTVSYGTPDNSGHASPFTQPDKSSGLWSNHGDFGDPFWAGCVPEERITTLFFTSLQSFITSVSHSGV